MKFSRVLIACIALASAFITAVQAAPSGYIVKNITVELEGDKPEALRATALTQAKTEALAMLLKQLTPQDQWGRHSWILAKENPDDYFKNFSIVHERGADNAYTLTVNVAFDPLKTRKMLLRHQLSFIENLPERWLVLPLWQDEGTALFTPNPWQKALKKEISRQHALHTFLFLKGTSAEQASLSVKKIAQKNTKILKKLAKQYQTDGTLTLKSYEATAEDGSPVLRINAQYFPATYSPITIEIPLKKEGYGMRALPFAAKGILEQLQANRQTPTLIRGDTENTLFVRFKAKKVADIEKMQQALDALPVVADVSPRLISRAESVFMVRMYSDIPSFLAALDRARITAVKAGALYQVSFR